MNTNSLEHHNEPSDNTNELSEEDLSQLKKCYNHAIKLLAAKDYSRYKMRKKLSDKGFESQFVESVMDEIVAKGYLREDLYIEARIKGFIFKGYSPISIVQRLSREYCETNQMEIENIMHEMGTSQAQVLEELIDKKLRLDYDYISDKEKLKNKTLRYAISRGFDYGQVKSCYERLIQDFE